MFFKKAFHKLVKNFPLQYKDMTRNTKHFFKIISSFSIMMFSTCFANAARVAIASTPMASARRIAISPQVTSQTTTVTTQPIETTIEPEPEIYENKSAKFNEFMADVASGDKDSSATSLAEQIRKQREILDTQDNVDSTNRSMLKGKNVCDSGLRECMAKECGDDFSKCAMDGDTMFGERLNRCRRQTTCDANEFKLFTAEIKADRDTNVRLASYNSVLKCGNDYNKCIVKECGLTFNKCLGKTSMDRAMNKCATIAQKCSEQDSGLPGRMGNVIGRLRETAEKDIKADEERMYKLRDLMRSSCERLGAMFDERSFDCVYTVNFFAGTNNEFPTASRKVYAGDSFACNQEWFGVNVTTYKENAYRETRAQTGASSALMGAGLGTAAGLWASGAVSRGIETQNAKKALKEECEQNGGRLDSDGSCIKQLKRLREIAKNTNITKAQDFTEIEKLLQKGVDSVMIEEMIKLINQYTTDGDK